MASKSQMPESFSPTTSFPNFRKQLRQIIAYVVQDDTAMTAPMKVVHNTYNYDWFYKKPMFIPDELDELLSSDTAPPFKFFINLPCALEASFKFLSKHAIVYALPLEKDGERPRLGISSATAAKGATTRMYDYRNKNTWRYSRYTRQALKEGYKIVNIGFLFIIPEWATTQLPLQKVWVKSIEAGITYHLWSVYQAPGKDITDHYMGHASGWTEYEWDGVNGSSPVSESVEGTEFTEEQMEEILELKRAKKKEWSRKYQQSEKGKASSLRYRTSEKGKTTKATYAKSYAQTEAGKATQARADKNYRGSTKDKARFTRYRQSAKGKAKGAAWRQSAAGKASQARADKKFRDKKKKENK